MLSHPLKIRKMTVLNYFNEKELENIVYQVEINIEVSENQHYQLLFGSSSRLTKHIQ
jgi:hypothetical protein